MEEYYHLALLVLALILGFLAFEKAKKKPQIKKPSLPPGPGGLPIIGSLHQLGKNPHRSLEKLSKLYGPIMYLKLGQVPAVILSSSDAAEAVLKTHDRDSCSRPALIAWKQISYNFSDVALSPYGASWRELRKILMVKLLCTNKVEGYRAMREEEVDRMISSISARASPVDFVNISQLVQSLSNSIICRIALGRRLEVGGPMEDLFNRILPETVALAIQFFVADYIPWAGWVDKLTGKQAALEKNGAETEAFCQGILTALAEETKPIEDEESIVDFMLRRLKENSDITMDNVKGLFIDMIIAATDTSSATIEYAMAELVTNPRTMMKAQEEVRSVIGGKGKVEETDIPQLIYLKSVVKETLRLHPAVPLLIPRETMEKITINGYDILPKTRVMVNVWAIGRDSASWERPNEFIPERFIDNPVDFRGQHFQFIPFGAGRRICPGISFGIMTVELALANLLYAFDWNVRTGMEIEDIDMAEGVGLTVRLRTALRLKASAYLRL